MLGRTRLLLPFVGSDHVLMAELVLQGKVIQVPETLAYKMVPDEGQRYRSHATLRGYMGGRNVEPWFLRFRMNKELLLSIRHIRPPDCPESLLALDVLASYYATGD